MNRCENDSGLALISLVRKLPILLYVVLVDFFIRKDLVKDYLGIRATPGAEELCA